MIDKERLRKTDWIKGIKKGYTKFNSGNISITTIEIGNTKELCNIHETDNSK